VKRHAPRSLLVVPVALAALALPAAGAQASPCVIANADAVPSGSHNSVQHARRQTLCLVNHERAKRGLRPLRLNKRLSRASLRHSRSMVRKHYFDHGNFVARIVNVRYVTRRQNWALAENLAWGTGSLSTPAQTVRAWMHSPGHRQNILNPRFRDIGIGIAIGAPALVHAAATAATYTTDFGLKG
jgi:uncharacterized protein YkwD